jgi:hypothetical protein
MKSRACTEVRASEEMASRVSVSMVDLGNKAVSEPWEGRERAEETAQRRRECFLQSWRNKLVASLPCLAFVASK